MPDDYQFFLSYARVDRDNYLDRFFEDLAAEVRRQVPLPSSVQASEVGFKDDRAIEVGEEWDEALVDGLQSARVFVPILTPGNVSSDNCGRELAVFLARLGASSGTAKKRSALVLPVLWDRPSRVRIPPVLKKFQLTHAELGATYAEKGLRYLARRSSSDPEYLDFIEEFADRLVQAREIVLPKLQSRPHWAVTLSAYSENPHGATAAGAPWAPAGEAGAIMTVPTANFAFVAGRPEEVAGVRAHTEGYSREGAGWRPFVPSNRAMVSSLAQITAGKEDLYFKTIEVDDTLVERMRAAENNGEIVVLVVDPWTVKLGSYHAQLGSVDESQFVNYGVLVLVNTEDPESYRESEVLREDVRQALRKTYVANPSYIRESIGNAEQFEREVVAAIGDARRRMAQLGEVRPWNGAAMRPIPVIDGPGTPQ